MKIESSESRAAEIRELHVLSELVSHHLPLREDKPAVTQYNPKTLKWETLSFRELYNESVRWAKAFSAAGLKKGDRVSMLLPNGINAVCFDQGALLIGLVPVPLHIIDTPANCAYILEDSDTKLLVTVNRARWHAIEKAGADLSLLKSVVYTDDESEQDNAEVVCSNVEDWLDKGAAVSELPPLPTEDDLAALVYTSGTTGKPKGVMLTHKNIMSDISSLLYNIAPNPEDSWLSFLPLSHTFERTTSYYIGLGMGNHVTFSRGIARILDDLKTTRPSIMMSVPRVYEKVAAKINERLKHKGSVSRFIFTQAVEAGYRNFCRRNGISVDSSVPAFLDQVLDPIYNKLVRDQIKNSFGGRMRVAVSGGASLSQDVAKTVIGLGIEIFQGYGMTETSPIISVNKIGANHPDTVGPILEGIEAKLGEKDELLVRGPQIMRGYWKRPEDTRKTLDPDGWLSTGDQADILPGRYLKIKGRIKEIIVTSTGEKVPPVDLEQAIETDPLIDQAMVYGENRPFICALIVVNSDHFDRFASSLNLDPKDPAILENKAVLREILKRIKSACKGFPQYGVPRAVKLLRDPWTIENNALTPTLKLKRRVIVEKYKNDIENLYLNYGK